MTPDEAQAELEDILIECTEWEQRAEMFEYQSRQWQERYAKCSDLLSDAEEDAETAEAERDRLREEYEIAHRGRTHAIRALHRTEAEAGHLRKELELILDAGDEADRLRHALEQILNASDIEAAVDLAAFALFFPTEEPKP